MSRLINATISLIFGLMILTSTSSATVFSDTHSFNWTPGQSTVPNQFFQDVTNQNPGSSFYDDGIPVFFETCLNPGDGTDCYPTFGGTAEVDVGFSIDIDGKTITTTDFGLAAFVSVIPDGKFLNDPANPGMGVPGGPNDIIAISSQTGGSVFVGPADRWQIISINVFGRFVGNSVPDPFGNSLVGIDLYSNGPSRELLFSIIDTTNGQDYVAIARNPEPTTAVLMGLGLMGLVASGRRRQ